MKKILVSLTDKFDNIITIIEETKDLSKITVEQLMGFLESHEQRKNRHINEEAVETALAAKFKNMSKEKVVHHEEEDSTKYKGTNAKLSCNICKKTNHDSENCWFE